ncbi:MAG: GFA family protein, partial [Gammaproteobacteria bacterium]
MQEVNYPIHGACQCGQVTYELLEAPLNVIACHCRECQKLSTSAFSLTALVEQQAIRFYGTLKHWERPSDSGNTNCAKFCPECGNRIYHYNPEKPEIIKLKPCTLEDTHIIQPTLHVWVSEKQDWFEIPA